MGDKLLLSKRELLIESMLILRMKKMMGILILSMVSMGCWAFPSGSPSCSLNTPSHSGTKSGNLKGAQDAGFNVLVTENGKNNWQVTVNGTSTFRGLLINTEDTGTWNIVDPDNFVALSNQGNCISHKNKGDKSEADFSFSSSSSFPPPQFCVVIVKTFSEHYY